MRDQSFAHALGIECCNAGSKGGVLGFLFRFGHSVCCSGTTVLLNWGTLNERGAFIGCFT